MVLNILFKWLVKLALYGQALLTYHTPLTSIIFKAKRVRERNE
ncbi:hypothetical protein P20429_3733 [Pseudoalteromonas sp. BSi20429]|uniref:Uncharacterized protein n=1 Tax=Pseudoalteromonas arctica A 37-1-2 TaxID=1117313 RepID=A0A290S5P8_9GAMM|nr:hypothetical protein PARC_a2010 [Pseudoalteromonas arctica A 37-1-2]GAA69595.1 hypothetical protein P20429_3733 [Pseudoalteromonas sp. BSi20429]